MGTGFFPGVKRPGRGADTHPLLAPRSRRVELYLYPPSRPVQACKGTALPLYIRIYRHNKYIYIHTYKHTHVPHTYTHSYTHTHIQSYIPRYQTHSPHVKVLAWYSYPNPRSSWILYQQKTLQFLHRYMRVLPLRYYAIIPSLKNHTLNRQSSKLQCRPNCRHILNAS
jgi:hypothetical protein